VTTADPSDDPTVTWDDIQDLMSGLKQRARELLAMEGNAWTVHTTQLVNSALKKLVPKSRDWQEVTWSDRHAFFKDAHFAMRRCLVDYARSRKRRNHVQVGAFESEYIAPLAQSKLLDLDRLTFDAVEQLDLAEALAAALVEIDEKYPGKDLAAIVQHRIFEGLSQVEIARLREIDERTVRNREKLAYALLRDALKRFY
jgi:DNA-directed RNA polymerase specialized sigma24 family protein